MAPTITGPADKGRTVNLGLVGPCPTVALIWHARDFSTAKNASFF